MTRYQIHHPIVHSDVAFLQLKKLQVIHLLWLWIIKQIETNEDSVTFVTFLSFLNKTKDTLVHVLDHQKFDLEFAILVVWSAAHSESKVGNFKIDRSEIEIMG